MLLKHALLSVAIFAIPLWASAQNACESPTAAQLHGQWLVTWDNAPAATERLRLGPNPEFADSLVGELQRTPPGAKKAIPVQLAGDVEDGQLQLEESQDGKTIHATWAADLTEKPCDRVIRGIWRRDRSAETPQPKSLAPAEPDSRRFALRRVSGW